MRSKKFLAVLLSCATLISSAVPVNAATLSFAKVSGKSVSSAHYGYNYGTGGASTGTSIGVSKNNTGSSLSSSFGTIENTLKVLPPSSGLVASGFNSATFGTGTNLASKKLPSSITLKQGKSYAFGYDYSKSRAGAVKWSVTNSKVLTGLVPLSYESQDNKKAVGKTCVTLKAAKKGACYLKLKVGAKTYKCRVRVTASGSKAAGNYEVTQQNGSSSYGGNFSSSDIKLKAGKTITKKVSMNNPYLAFHVNRDDSASVYWTCTSLGKKSSMSATSVFGKYRGTSAYAQFKFKKTGTYMITAKAVTEKGKTVTYRCKLTVKK